MTYQIDDCFNENTTVSTGHWWNFKNPQKEGYAQAIDGYVVGMERRWGKGYDGNIKTYDPRGKRAGEARPELVLTINSGGENFKFSMDWQNYQMQAMRAAMAAAGCAQLNALIGCHVSIVIGQAQGVRKYPMNWTISAGEMPEGLQLIGCIDNATPEKLREMGAAPTAPAPTQYQQGVAQSAAMMAAQRAQQAAMANPWQPQQMPQQPMQQQPYYDQDIPF